MSKPRKIHPKPGKKEKEYLEGWQRATAELDNFKKRLQSEKELQKVQLREEVITPLLSLADNFQSIAKFVPKEIEDNPWTKGVLHVARQFNQLLEDSGVIPIEKTDEEFDPTIHEAIEEIKDKNKQSGLVVEVMQRGYRIGDRVIRPAKVKVTS